MRPKPLPPCYLPMALGVSDTSGMIDVNIHLSRWPARRLPCDEVTPLVAKLQAAGIERAWAGSFDGLLHKDIAAVNARLAEDCAQRGAGLLVPFGSVNPTLPDWQDDLRRCAREHKMPGIRLHPNYHGYKLDDPRFAELLDLAIQYQLIVQLAVKMEDERTQHRLLSVEPVDTTPLVELLPSRPQLRLVVLNSQRSLHANLLSRLLALNNVFIEISMLEGIGGITQLLAFAPLNRILFGSHFPFFYLESALLKLRESELAQFQIDAITRDNARSLFLPSTP